MPTHGYEDLAGGPLITSSHETDCTKTVISMVKLPALGLEFTSVHKGGGGAAKCERSLPPPTFRPMQGQLESAGDEFVIFLAPQTGRLSALGVGLYGQPSN